ncbi:MAG: holdfast anchoring protein HfaA [Alphaproteobacteria bacterium]
MQMHSRPRLRHAATLILCLAAASAASAQTLETGSASVSIGYARTPGQESRPLVLSNYGVRDASGNLVVIDGVIQNASAQSYSASSASARASASASGTFTGGVCGGGSITSSAIGNNLTVITQGDNNTVIVNSTQINNGKVTATATATTPAPSTTTTGGN